MQPINVSSGPPNQDFAQLHAAQKVAVQRAQKSLYDESTMFKDGKRRPPNVVGLFRTEAPRLNRVALVTDPHAGVVPDEIFATQGRNAIVVRRELDPASEGIGGHIYVVASCPRILMSYTRTLQDDGTVLEGKPAADAYLKQMKSIA